jgi:anti-sigma factor RsiW
MLLRGPRAPERNELAMALLEQEAVASHVVYAADRGHPIEVPGSEKSELAQWLSDRLKRTVAPPDLSGRAIT